MVGDQNDMLGRLKQVLPARWFGDETPVLDALLGGIAIAWSGLYSLVQTVYAQARIATAGGIFLDMAAQDYFGAALPRRAGEADAAYSQRIRANLITPRATRSGLVAALTSLTGRPPAVFEPFNITDTGTYNSGTLGYGAAGGYGSLRLPFQFFVTAYRPNALPVSNASGYSVGPGGYNTAPMYYVNSEEFSGTISDAEIYNVIASVRPTGSIAWTKLSN